MKRLSELSVCYHFLEKMPCASGQCERAEAVQSTAGVNDAKENLLNFRNVFWLDFSKDFSNFKTFQNNSK